MEEKHIKVLIVDDDKDMRSFLSEVLVRKGFIVEEAGNGMEGLEKVQRNRPDIILLDGSMPKVGGMEMFRQLRGNPGTRDIPVIFCTSSTISDYVRDLVMENGDYLRKPFACKELYEKIGNVLGQDLSGEQGMIGQS